MSARRDTFFTWLVLPACALISGPARCDPGDPLPLNPGHTLPKPGLQRVRRGTPFF